jgi:hypothetical protein
MAGPVEKGAHFYRSLQVDAHGNRLINGTPGPLALSSMFGWFLLALRTPSISE